MSLTVPFFAQLMDVFDLPPRVPVAVAVSGGADSLCLTILLHKWGRQTRHPIIALTVDHGLRPESAAEAATVRAFCAERGMAHHTLVWTGTKPKTRVEERARDARYKLMTDFCRQNGIDFLCLAHHLGDQTETFLTRLARGSGVDGLAAMKPVAARNGIRLLRPLLTVPKTDLTAYLTGKGLTWAEDPMNVDPQYERVKWRQLTDTLTQNGLTPTAVGVSAKRLNRARTALDFYTNAFVTAHITVDNRGFARIDTDAFQTAPRETQIRVLARVLQIIGQPQKQISLDALEQTVERLSHPVTLAECHIVPHKTGLYIAKEHARQPKPVTLPAHEWHRWDRFWIYADCPVRVRAAAPDKRVRDIPYLVQQSFPQITKKVENDTHSVYIHFTPIKQEEE